jgi:hypothetical protein
MPTTAAGQIWPHLPHDDERLAKPSKSTVADAMWPSLSREAKAREADQRLWDAICERNRQSLLRNLRELNARLREGRR